MQDSETQQLPVEKVAAEKKQAQPKAQQAPVAAKKEQAKPVEAPKTDAPKKGLSIVRKGAAPTGEDGYKKVDHTKTGMKHTPREGYVARDGKRQYDRHDGTGRAHEGDKKQGAGKGNWGKPEDAIADANAPVTDEAAAAAAPVEQTPKEPEVHQKTLDEYLAEKKAAKPAIQAPKKRLANEGEKNIEKKWGETVIVSRETEKKTEEVKKVEKKVEKKTEEKKTEEIKKVPITDVLNVATKQIREDRPKRFGEKPEPEQHQHKKAAAKAPEFASNAEFPALGK